jgi:hypothetical protein
MAEELVVFDPVLAKELVAAYRQLIDSGLLDQTIAKTTKEGGTKDAIVANTHTPIYFKNDSEHVIPPYALMQIGSTTEVSGSHNYITVKRPIHASVMRCPMLINGSREVEVDGYGVAQSGPVFRLLTDGTAYSPGDRLGPETGVFTATYGSMYAVIGDDDVATDVVRVMFDTSTMRGKTKAGGMTAGVPTEVYALDATGTVLTTEYLAESDAANIPGDTHIIMFSAYGSWLVYEVC